MREYVVQPGDTLWHVASKTLGPNGDWRVLATLNQIPDPKQLRVGQRLKLPTPIVATVNGHPPTPAAT
ncbi:LysM peptidoglycan-binding domain-containing protein, partial [Trichothermofontia sp.]